MIENIENQNEPSSQNLHMSEADTVNLEKIPKNQKFMMKLKDIEFIKQTILNVTKSENTNLKKDEQKEFKIKKWSSEEVGKLIFSLWQIHEGYQNSSMNSPKYKCDTTSHYSTSTKNVHSISFYKSLKDFFNGCNIPTIDQTPNNFSEKRTHDIIYSKLQKQRQAISVFEKIMMVEVNKKHTTFD